MNVEELMKRINENKILGYKLFGIPVYIFVFILAVTEAANLLGVVPQSMTGSIGVMFVIGVVLGEIGDRLPIWKDYLGGGTLLALLGSSVMVYFGLLSESTVTSISELMQTTDFITFFSAVLICGSILSIDRKILLKSFLGYIPIVLAGVLVAAALGFLGGLAFGKSMEEILLYYFLPIFGGGTGAGAVPMSQMYEAAGMGPASEFLTRAVPIITLGLVLSIIAAALVNKLGRMYPSLSGDGRLSRNESLENITEDEKVKADRQSIGAAFVLSTGYYILGEVLSKALPKIFGVSIHAFAWMVILLAASSMLDLIPASLRAGARDLQNFFASQFSCVIMVGVGVVYVSISDILAVLTVSNLVMALLLVVGAMVGTALMGRLLGFYTVETVATAALCMSNTGGAGDVAVLAAAQRMNLLSWAQISTRIGGGMMLVLASVLMSFFAG